MHKNSLIWLLFGIIIPVPKLSSPIFNINSHNLTFYGKIDQNLNFKILNSNKKELAKTCLNCEFHEKLSPKLLKTFENNSFAGSSILSYDRNNILSFNDSHFNTFKLQKSSGKFSEIIQTNVISANSTHFKNVSKRFFYQLLPLDNLLIVFEDNYVISYLKHFNFDKLELKLLSESKFPIQTNKIRKVANFERVLIILSKKAEIIFAHISENGEFRVLKKLNSRSIIWDIAKVEKVSFTIIDFQIKKAVKKRKQKTISKIKHCLKANNFEEQKCVEITDFSIEVSLIEPLHSKDRSLLKINFGEFLATENIKRTKLKLAFTYGVYNNFKFGNHDISLLRKKENGFWLKIGKIEREICKKKPKILYAGFFHNFYLISIQIEQEIVIYQFFKKPKNHSIEKIIIKKIKVPILIPKNAIISPNFIPFLERSKFHFILSFQNQINLFKIPLGSFLAICKPVKHLFFLKCNQKFELRFLDWKEYIYAKNIEYLIRAYEVQEININYVVLNVKWENLLILPIFILIGIGMYFLMKPRAVKKAKARYEMIRKLN